MKLFQALKLKNKLVAEITNKKSLIQQKNSREEGETNYYNVNQLFKDLTTHIDNLTALKIAINDANSPIQHIIYELAETKTMLNFIKGLNTQEGVIKNRFASDTESKYVVAFNELQKNELVEQYQSKIDTMQEDIDVFNHTTDIKLDVSNFLILKKK